MISSFVYSSDAKAYHPLLLRMSYNDKAFIAPAQSFVDEMSNALYVVGVEGKRRCPDIVMETCGGKLFLPEGRFILQLWFNDTEQCCSYIYM